MNGLCSPSDALDEGLAGSQIPITYSITSSTEFDDISIDASQNGFVFEHIKTFLPDFPWIYHRSGTGKVGRPRYIPAHFDDRKGRFVAGHLQECGDILGSVDCSFSGCETRKEDHRIHSSCGTLGCPVCFRSVADLKANVVSEHQHNVKAVFESEWDKLAYHKRFGEEKHFVFSPSQDGKGSVWLGPLLNKAGKDISKRRRRWSRAELEADGCAAMNRELRRILKESFDGQFYPGTIIWHMERKKHFASAPHHRNAYGNWSVCYDDDCHLEHEVFDDWVSCEDDDCQLEHVWVYGPHVHFDGYGYIEPSPSFHARTGWQYHKIPNTSGRSTFATVGYLLKHSAIFERVDEDGKVHRRRSYSHVSLFSNRYCGFLERSRELKPSICKSCGSPKCKYETDEHDRVDYSHDLGIHNEVVVSGNYYVRIDGQVYPDFLRKSFDERASRSAERRAFANELKVSTRRLSVVGSKQKVWEDPSQFVLKDGRVLPGFRDPNIVLWRSRPPSHRRRYRPHAFVGVK